jgi:hypothetical protein
VTVDAATLDAAQFTAQYERLRSHIIAAAGDALQLGAHPRGVGLGLLLREGMPGWLKAIDAAIRASAAQRTTEPSPELSPAERPAEFSITSPWLAGVKRHDVAVLLTSLVLSTRRVEWSSSRQGCQPCQ